MTEHAERGAPVWSVDNVVASLLVRDANPVALVALAGAVVLAAAWAVFSPPIVFSSEMTWDLLFNLSGAWHLRFGHVPHVDFHEPVGALNFMLTALGFALVGDRPHALLVGVAIVTAFIFGAACLAAWRRLPLLPAAIFMAFVCLLVLRPANLGDTPNAYSFAMTYNRYGWSGVSVIALILFLPPRRGPWAAIVEMSLVAAMLVAMFHLKVTYFLVGCGLIVASFVTSPHVRVRWPGWLAVGAIGLAAALLPSSQPYLADLAAAARAGVVRDDAAFFFNDIAENAGQYAPYVAAVAIAVWLWRRGSATIGLPLASVVLLLGALSLLSQNSQSHGVPLALVIAFLLYETLRSARAQAGRAVMLGALLAFPLASIVGSATSIFGYQARTGAGYMHVVDSTNLRGLAVPRQPGDVIAEFSRDRPTYRLLSRARAVRPRYELSPLEYVQTLQQAATLLREQGRAHGRIAVLDQVNPLPFMLGLAPPRGGNLWSGAGAPTPAAEAYLGDADHVLIPKFTTNAAWTEQAQALYADYIARHFPNRVEGRGWIVLSREATMPNLPGTAR